MRICACIFRAPIATSAAVAQLACQCQWMALACGIAFKSMREERAPAAVAMAMPILASMPMHMAAMAAQVGLLLLLPSAAALDNGLAPLPPRAWRSWNAFHENFNQSTIHSMIDALTEKSRDVGGVPTSLQDLGYNMIGIDEGSELGRTRSWIWGRACVPSHTGYKKSTDRYPIYAYQ